MRGSSGLAAASPSILSQRSMMIMTFSHFGRAAVLAAFTVLSGTAAAPAEELQKQAATAPADIKADGNLAAHGQELYAHHCSHCHGFNMVNSGAIAFDLRKFPHDDKNRFVNSVTNGKNNRMPPWGDLLSKDEIDSLWAYVSSYKQQ